MSAGSALRGFFGLVWRILEGIRKVLHLALILVIFGFVLAALHTSIPIVPRSAALVISPQGELVEQLSGDSVRRALGEASGGPDPETLLRDVTDSIALAKTDSRIKLIVLGAQDFARRGCGARVPDFQSLDQRSQREAPRQCAPCQALLPARTVGQGRPHRREGLSIE